MMQCFYIFNTQQLNERMAVMKKKNNAQGFTLVELMIVIVIVGILAAVAIPKYTQASYKAKASEFPTILMQIYTAQSAYEAEMSRFSTSLDTIGVDIGTSKWFTYAIPLASGTNFRATAKPTVGIGDATTSDSAAIDQDGNRTASPSLKQYANNWE